MDNFAQDIRLALRMLRKSPGTTVLAVLVLGIGIGATSAMFGLVNVLLLKPLAVAHPEQLVGCFSKDRESNAYRAFSYPNFDDLRSRSKAFSQLTAHNLAMVGLSEDGITRRTIVDVVASNYLETFGVAPVLGRDFLTAEEHNGEPVVMVSHHYWKRHGGEPGIIGSQVVLNGEPYTVVGVTPPDFGGTSSLLAPDILAPLGVYNRLINDFMEGGDRPLTERDNHALVLIGRLAEGFDMSQANAEVAGVAAALEAAYPAVNEKQTFELHPLSRMSVSTAPTNDTPVAAVSALLMAMAAIVLLIAALNLATVQNARAVAREREIAVRLALGSRRLRVMRQLLIESLVLALGGGVLGLFASYLVPEALGRSLSRMAPFDFMIRSNVDWRVVSATLAFCVLATMVFGLLPALRMSRTSQALVLRERSASGSGARTWSRANVPVLLELALSTVLLVAGGLFLKGALNGTHLDPGFRIADHVLLEIDPSLIGYDETRGREVTERLLERLRRVPGVRSASLANTVPFGMVSQGNRVAPAEQKLEPEDRGISATSNLVSAGYFATMGIPLLRGRELADQETTDVVVIDRVLAEKLWPGADPLGRQLRLLSDEREDGGKQYEVVGLVATTLDSLLDRTESGHIYRSVSQRYNADVNVHLSVEPTPSQAATQALLDDVRDAVREVDERLPVLTLRTMQEHLEASADFWLLRTGARVFSTFGSIALLLAVAGVYGVRAFSVARRTHEIGIRMAVGASMRDTLWLVLREGLRLTALGVGVGLALSLGVGQLLQGFLVQVNAYDPLVYAATLATLGLVSLAACYLPARRASVLDPLLALRDE